eukprot:1194353-Prorocentrum_minimum.AAC.8
MRARRYHLLQQRRELRHRRRARRRVRKQVPEHVPGVPEPPHVRLVDSPPPGGAGAEHAPVPRGEVGKDARLREPLDAVDSAASPAASLAPPPGNGGDAGGDAVPVGGRARPAGWWMLKAY